MFMYHKVITTLYSLRDQHVTCMNKTCEGSLTVPQPHGLDPILFSFLKLYLGQIFQTLSPYSKNNT